MPQNDVLILEYVHSQSPDFFSPGTLARVVLVIAGHEICAMPGRQTRERGRVRRELLDGAIHQIARHRDQIRMKFVDPTNNAFDEAFLDGRAYVNIADLRNGKPVQTQRNILVRNLYLDDAGPASHKEHA